MNQILLIIDAQQELIDGNKKHESIFNKEQLVSTINKVIEKARVANVPVVLIRDLDVADGKGDGFQIHNEIDILAETKIFDKAATNCFYMFHCRKDILLNPKKINR